MLAFFRSRGYTKNWSESERSIRNLSVIETNSGTCSRRRSTKITFTSSRQQLLQQPPQLPSPHRQRTAGSSWHPLTLGKVTTNPTYGSYLGIIHFLVPTLPSFRKVALLWLSLFSWHFSLFTEKYNFLWELQFHEYHENYLIQVVCQGFFWAHCAASPRQ